MKFYKVVAGIIIGTCVGFQTYSQKGLSMEEIQDVKPRNIIFILSDDHRYDYMGFTGAVPWLEILAMRSIG